LNNEIQLSREAFGSFTGTKEALTLTGFKTLLGLYTKICLCRQNWTESGQITEKQKEKIIFLLSMTT